MRKIIIICPLIMLICFQFYIDCFGQKQKQKHFCNLFNSSSYNEQIFTTQAILYTQPNTDEYFYSFSCNNRDYFALADFSNASNLSLLQDQLVKLPEGKTQNRLLLTFKGKLYISLPPEYGNLSYLRAKFEVQLIKSIKVLPPSNKVPNDNTEAFIIDNTKSLEAVNNDLVLSLYASRFKDNKLRNLFTDRTKILIDKKSISKEVFMTEMFIENEKSLVLKTDKITQQKDKWQIKGVVTNKLKNNFVKRIKYNNNYELKPNGSWELILFTIDSEE